MDVLQTIIGGNISHSFIKPRSNTSVNSASHQVTCVHNIKPVAHDYIIYHHITVPLME